LNKHNGDEAPQKIPEVLEWSWFTFAGAFVVRKLSEQQSRRRDFEENKNVQDPEVVQPADRMLYIDWTLPAPHAKKLT